MVGDPGGSHDGWMDGERLVDAREPAEEREDGWSMARLRGSICLKQM